MIYGVIGFNEYENNVNNNWYMNFMVCWMLEYMLVSLKKVDVVKCVVF